MRTAEQVYSAWSERKKRMSSVMAAATRMRVAYNGDLPVATPELSENERAAIANLFVTGIDQYGMRVASTRADVDCPPDRTGRSAKTRAKDRRNTLLAWETENRLPLKDRRRARHLVGYATSPVLIRPWREKQIPFWDVRDPLSTYPAYTEPDELVPPDCIFSSRRPLRWVYDNYPRQSRSLSVGDAGPDTMFDILQYVDAEQMMLMCVGSTDHNGYRSDAVLTDQPNLAGVPLVVIPGRITLDRLQGQFDQMIGMYQTEAELWALQLIAIRRAVFAEVYAVGGMDMTFQEADPITGEMGYVKGGDVKAFRPGADQMGLQAIDRLERGTRLAGGIPQEFGGEGASNVRTGRRGSQVLSAQVDFPIQELQELLAAARQEEYRAAIKVAKGWYGNQTKTFAVKTSRTPVTYTPNITFDNETVFVSYPYAGTDTNGLVIEGGQRMGMGTESRLTFMRNDPMISDPEAEHDQIQVERLEDAFFSSIQAQAADPNGPYSPDDLAYLTELVVEKDVPLYKAVQQVHARAQARQQEAAEGAQIQPGLAQPGAPGTPEAAAAIQGPNSEQENLLSLLGNLRLTQRQSPGELASVTG